MKNREFANLTKEALMARITDLRREYFTVKADISSGKEKNVASGRVLRRRIAQAKTALTQHSKVA